jgi:hypothetical protein
MSEQPSLTEQLLSEPTRPRVVAECVTLIDKQVKAKTGLKGVALKGAYGVIKTIKRGFLPGVVDSLLPDWLGRLEPYYQTWLGEKKPDSFSEFVIARSDEVAEELLAVTDGRAENTKHKRAKKYYFKMRDKAKENVVEAIPDLSRLIERHLQADQDGDAKPTA